MTPVRLILPGERRSSAAIANRPVVDILTGSGYGADGADFAGFIRRIELEGLGVNVMSHGASPGASASVNTAAFQEAQAIAEAADMPVLIPPGAFAYNARLFDITGPLAIIGAGPSLTRLIPDPAYSGYAIRLNNCWRATSQALANEELDWSVNKSRVVLRGFAIAGNRANVARGIEFYQINDQFYIDDIELLYLKGKALAIGSEDTLGLAREAFFHRVVVWRCGNASTNEPAIHISTGATAGDQTNELHFMATHLVYPDGVGLRIDNAQSVGRTRRIGFVEFMMHGSNQITPQPAGHLCEIVGAVDSIQFDNLKTNGSTDVGGTKYACIHITNSGADIPSDIKIDYHVSNCSGDAIKITKATRTRIAGTAQNSSISGQELILATDSALQGVEYLVKADPSNRKITVNNVGDLIDYGHRIEVDGWFQDNVAASQTAVQLGRSAAAAFASKWIASKDFSIIGLWAKASEVATAGAATIEAYVNGVATGLTVSLFLASGQFRRTHQALGLDRVAAGDEVDLRITTNGAWAPSTLDLRCGIVLV